MSLPPTNDSDSSEDKQKQTKAIPDFAMLRKGRLEPFHAKEATDRVLETFQQELEVLKDNVQQSKDDDDQLERFLLEWNRIQEPVLTLFGTLYLLSQVANDEDNHHGGWAKAQDSLDEQRKAVMRDHLAWIRALLDDNEQKSTKVLSQRELQCATQVLRLLLERDHGRDKNNRGEEDEERYQMLRESLERTKRVFVQECQKKKSDGPYNSTRERVALLYNLVGLSNDVARAEGHADYGTQILQHHNRMAHKHEVDQLHQVTAEHLLPKHDSRPHFAALEELLRANEASEQVKAEIQQSKKGKEVDPKLVDRWMMVRLEKHVTLDGAMDFLSQFSKTIFGVELKRDEADQSSDAAAGWTADVRLYHIVDTESQQPLGAFFLDPFRRPGKTTENCTMPVQVRSSDGTRIPVMALVLQIESPTWDDGVAMLTWDDLQNLFHEMGHILQDALTTHSALGTVLGGYNMPRDASEILPFFMEKWLWERSTLYGLIAASGLDVTADLNDDAVDALYRVQRRRKTMELLRLVFLGTLEWNLFFADSPFYNTSPEKKESIMALQHRLAQELLLPDDPSVPASSSDLTPVFDVLLPNASGIDPLGRYSYLWADAVSAIVFGRMKEAYTAATNDKEKQAMTQSLRRLLLKPGAAIADDEIRAEFGVGDCVSPHEMFELYGLNQETEDAGEAARDETKD